MKHGLAFLWLAAALTGCSDDGASGTDAGDAAPSRADAGREGGLIEPGTHDTALTVMTYNVLCSTICGLGEYDPWAERVVHHADIYARHDPDLMALQELATVEDVQQVLDAVPGREAIYFDDGKAWADATIVYRKARFDVLDHGDYWLSPTPDEPRTAGFSGGLQLARLVVWAVLYDRYAGRELFFASTHFDNNSPSQEKSAPLVLERTLPFVKTHPVIFAGDFNSMPDSEAYQILTGKRGDHGFAFTEVEALADDWSVITNRKPAPEYDRAMRIDHIFLAGADVDWRAASWHPDMTSYGPLDLYPSDHFPIVTRLDIGRSPGDADAGGE